MLRVRAGGRKEPIPIIGPYGIRIIYEDTTSTIVGCSYEMEYSEKKRLCVFTSCLEEVFSAIQGPEAMKRAGAVGPRLERAGAL